jgi:hypothetical protein
LVLPNHSYNVDDWRCYETPVLRRCCYAIISLMQLDRWKSLKNHKVEVPVTQITKIWIGLNKTIADSVRDAGENKLSHRCYVKSILLPLPHIINCTFGIA